MNETEIRPMALQVAAELADRVPFDSLVERVPFTESRPAFFGILRREVQVEKTSLLIEGWRLWSLVKEREELRTIDPAWVVRTEELACFLYLRPDGQIVYASREVKRFNPRSLPPYARADWAEEPRVATYKDLGEPEVSRESVHQLNDMGGGQVKELWAERGAWHDETKTKGDFVVRALRHLRNRLSPTA